jgi:hypothetical protein
MYLQMIMMMVIIIIILPELPMYMTSLSSKIRIPKYLLRAVTWQVKTTNGKVVCGNRS